MDPLDYDKISPNPDIVGALMLGARRERAEAVHRLLFAPIARLFGARHAARTNLGHPRKACSAPA